MGVSLSGVRRLLHNKCDIDIKKSDLERRLEYLTASERLHDRNLTGIDHKKLGDYLRHVLPNPKKFERLIRFRPEEEDQLDLVNLTYRFFFVMGTNIIVSIQTSLMSTYELCVARMKSWTRGMATNQ